MKYDIAIGHDFVIICLGENVEIALVLKMSKTADIRFIYYVMRFNTTLYTDM